MKPSPSQFLCVTIIAIGVLTAANVLPQSPATGVLRVTVRNNETKEPIAGARVTLTPTAVAATPAQNGTAVGRVVDKDGVTPLRGATIWIDSLASQNGRIEIRQRFTATTDLDGRYRASNIYIGRVRATLVLNAQPVMTKGEMVGDELFTANGVETVANFNLNNAPSQPPNVPANVNAAGAFDPAALATAVAGIRTNFSAAGAVAGTQTFLTNADGAVAFDKLQPGSYQIRAEHEGYMGLGANGLAAALSATTSLVTVGAQPSEVSMLMMPSASISGRVLDASGAAIPTARVIVGTIGYREGRRTFLAVPSAAVNAQTDADGAFTLSTLPAGEYYLRVETPPGGIGWYYPGVTHIRDALRVPVSTGQQLVGIDFQLSNAPVFKVSGVVVGGPNPPLPNGQPDLTVPSMTFVSADQSDVDTTSTPLIPNNRRGANGEFEISLPAGLWDIFPVINLRALAAGANPTLVAAGSPNYATGRARVLITDRDVDNVALPVAASDIKGRFDMDGAPSNSPMRVSLIPREPTPSPLLSHLRTAQLLDPNGNFSFTAVPPGKYSLRVDAVPAGFYLADIRLGSKSIYGDGVLTVETEPLEQVEVIFRRGGGSVQVRFDDLPLAQRGGQGFFLVPTGTRAGNNMLYKSATAGRTNTFASVPPGDYKVFAFASWTGGGAEQNAEFMKPYQDLGVPVTVIDGQTTVVDVRWIP